MSNQYSRCNYSCNCYCDNCCPPRPNGPSAPFLSSYLEVLGGSQTVGIGQDFAFDVDSADTVGRNMTIDPTGKIITITKTGLYRIEWDMILSQGTQLAVVGVMENGKIASGMASNREGNFSSGTLIHVESVPFKLSLRNYGGEVSITAPVGIDNAALSIRITRFADAPNRY